MEKKQKRDVIFYIAILLIPIQLAGVFWSQHRRAKFLDRQAQWHKEDSIQLVKLEQLKEDYKAMLKTSDSLEELRVKQKIINNQIPVRYETIRNNVRKLLADSQLCFFSTWLSQIVDTGR